MNLTQLRAFLSRPDVIEAAEKYTINRRQIFAAILEMRERIEALEKAEPDLSPSLWTDEGQSLAQSFGFTSLTCEACNGTGSVGGVAPVPPKDPKGTIFERIEALENTVVELKTAVEEAAKR